MVQVTSQILNNLNLNLSAPTPDAPSQTEYEQSHMYNRMRGAGDDLYEAEERARAVEQPPSDYDSRYSALPMNNRDDNMPENYDDNGEYPEDEYSDEEYADEEYADDGQYDEEYADDGQYDDEYVDDGQYDRPQSFAGRNVSPSYDDSDDYGDDYSDDYGDDSYGDDNYDNDNYDNNYDNDSGFDGNYDESQSGGSNYGTNYENYGGSYASESYVAPETKIGYSEHIFNDEDLVDYQTSDELDMFHFEDRKIPNYNGEPIGDYSMETLMGEYSKPSKPMNVTYDASKGYDMGGNVGMNFDEVLGMGALIAGTSALGAGLAMDINSQRMMAKDTTAPERNSQRRAPRSMHGDEVNAPTKQPQRPQLQPQSREQSMSQFTSGANPNEYIESQFGNLQGIGGVGKNERGDFDVPMNDDYFGFKNFQPEVRKPAPNQNGEHDAIFGEHVPASDIFGFGGVSGLNDRDPINQVSLSSATSLEESLGLGKMNMGNSNDIIGFGSFADNGKRQGLFESGANIDFGLGLGGRIDSTNPVNDRNTPMLPVFSLEEALFGSRNDIGANPQNMMGKRTTAPPQEMNGFFSDIKDKVKEKVDNFKQKREDKKWKKLDEKDVADISDEYSDPKKASEMAKKMQSSQTSSSSSTSLVPVSSSTPSSAGTGVATAVATAVGASASSGGGINGPDKVKVGKSATYTTSCSTPLWEVSDSSVAMIDTGGVLKGIKAGTVVVSVRDASASGGTKPVVASKVVTVKRTFGQNLQESANDFGKNVGNTAKYLATDKGGVSLGIGNLGSLEKEFESSDFAVTNDSRGLIGDFHETNYDPLHFQNVDMLNTMTNANDVAGQFQPQGGTNWSNTFGNFGADTARTTSASGRTTEAPMQSFGGIIGNFGKSEEKNINMNGNGDSRDDLMLGGMGGSGWAYQTANDQIQQQPQNSGSFSDMFGFNLGNAYKTPETQNNDDIFVSGDNMPAVAKVYAPKSTESQSEQPKVSNGNTKMPEDMKKSVQSRSKSNDGEQLSQAEKFKRSNQKLLREKREDNDIEFESASNRSAIPRDKSGQQPNTIAARRVLPPTNQANTYYPRQSRRALIQQTPQQYYDDYEQQPTDPRLFLSRMVDNNSDYTEQFNRGYEVESDPSALGAFGLGALSGAIFGKSAGVTDGSYDYMKGDGRVGVDMDAMVGGDDMEDYGNDVSYGYRSPVQFYDEPSPYSEPQVESDINGMIGYVQTQNNDGRIESANMNDMFGFRNDASQYEKQNSGMTNCTLPQSSQPRTRVRGPVVKRRNVTTRVTRASDGSTTTVTTTTMSNGTKYRKTVKTAPKKSASAKSTSKSSSKSTKSTSKSTSKSSTKKSTLKKITGSSIAKKANENMFATGLERKPVKKQTVKSKKSTTKSTGNKMKSKESENNFNSLIWG